MNIIDLAKELVKVVQTLPDTLQEFKTQMDKMANELKDEFTQVADERLEKLQEAYNHFFNESLKLRESVLDVDKALIDFKIKMMEEHTHLKEGVSKFERDSEAFLEFCRYENSVFSIYRVFKTSVKHLISSFRSTLTHNYALLHHFYVPIITYHFQNCNTFLKIF